MKVVLTRIALISSLVAGALGLAASPASAALPCDPPAANLEAVCAAVQYYELVATVTDLENGAIVSQDFNGSTTPLYTEPITLSGLGGDTTGCVGSGDRTAEGVVTAYNQFNQVLWKFHRSATYHWNCKTVHIYGSRAWASDVNGLFYSYEGTSYDNNFADNTGKWAYSGAMGRFHQCFSILVFSGCSNEHYGSVDIDILPDGSFDAQGRAD